LILSSGFLLDQVRLGRGPFDLVDALIIVAVTQANVDPVMRDPALQRAYATYEAPPPDALRRPISVNALAHSLRMPFETMRRRVSRLVRVGVFRATADGVCTSGAAVRSPFHRMVAEAGYGRVLAVWSRLDHLADLRPRHYADAWPGAPPVRAVARISAEYLLSVVDLLTAELGDPMDAAVWLEILRSRSAAARPAATECVADPHPLRCAAIAKRLGLPRETVRRRVAHLASRSACTQVRGGLVVPDEILARPEFVRIARRNITALRRMLAALARLGAIGPARTVLTEAA
jgi:hypothetical protein